MIRKNFHLDRSEINIKEQISNDLKLLKILVFLLGLRTVVTCLVKTSAKDEDY